MLNSGLLKQIDNLRNSMKRSINYFDVNYKEIDENGSITVRGIPCILQKYKIWLMSDTFDYHRKPGYGGFLGKHVVKTPLTQENAESIKSLLILETEKNFPDINLIKCKVEANLNRRRWEITVVPQDKRSGIIDSSMVDGEEKAIVCKVD